MRSAKSFGRSCEGWDQLGLGSEGGRTHLTRVRSRFAVGSLEAVEQIVPSAIRRPNLISFSPSAPGVSETTSAAPSQVGAVPEYWHGSVSQKGELEACESEELAVQGRLWERLTCERDDMV